MTPGFHPWINQCVIPPVFFDSYRPAQQVPCVIFSPHEETEQKKLQFSNRRRKFGISSRSPSQMGNTPYMQLHRRSLLYPPALSMVLGKEFISHYAYHSQHTFFSARHTFASLPTDRPLFHRRRLVTQSKRRQTLPRRHRCRRGLRL